jgi:hypothetical protein
MHTPQSTTLKQSSTCQCQRCESEILIQHFWDFLWSEGVFGSSQWLMVQSCLLPCQFDVHVRAYFSLAISICSQDAFALQCHTIHDVR